MPHDLPGEPPCPPQAILDTVEATARVLGNGGLYLRMLRRFRDDHPADRLPIRAALDSGDLGLAHRLAHTLKGTAGMIGAHCLHDKASVLEHTLRTAGAIGARGALDSVEHALGDVLVAVERVLAGEPADGQVRSHVAASTTALAPLGDGMVDTLAALLDVGDGAAIDLLEQSRAALSAALGEAVFSEVMLAAHAFDFEAALAALRRAGLVRAVQAIPTGART